jgi:hypothetical protein
MSTLNVHHWQKSMNRIPAIYRKHVKIILNGLHNISDDFKRYRIMESIAKRGENSSGTGEFTVYRGYPTGSGGGTKSFNNKLSAAAQLCVWLDGLGHSPIELGCH